LQLFTDKFTKKQHLFRDSPQEQEKKIASTTGTKKKLHQPSKQRTPKKSNKEKKGDFLESTKTSNQNSKNLQANTLTQKNTTIPTPQKRKQTQKFSQPRSKKQPKIPKKD
jgi:hypothetical protein